MRKKRVCFRKFKSAGELFSQCGGWLLPQCGKVRADFFPRAGWFSSPKYRAVFSMRRGLPQGVNELFFNAQTGFLLQSAGGIFFPLSSCGDRAERADDRGRQRRHKNKKQRRYSKKGLPFCRGRGVFRKNNLPRGVFFRKIGIDKRGKTGIK